MSRGACRESPGVPRRDCRRCRPSVLGKGAVARGKQLDVGPVLQGETRKHSCRVSNPLGKARKVFWAAAPVVLLCALPLRAQKLLPASASLDIAPGSVNSGSEPTAVMPSPPETKNDRLFFLLPNYLMVEDQDHFAPLPVKTKFELSAKTMTDPVTISFLGAIALLGQARNSDPSYGQGMQGYAKRYATVYADTGIGTLMTASVFPTILHQDPRYFQRGSGGVWRRTVYAVSQIFVTRSDSGQAQFNYSEIAGNAVAAGISNTYHPKNQRTLGNTLSVWGTDTMLNALCNVAKEFWPDLRRKIRKHDAD